MPSSRVAFVDDLVAVRCHADDALVGLCLRRRDDLDGQLRHVGDDRLLFLERELILQIANLPILRAMIGAQLDELHRQLSVFRPQL